MDKKYILKNLFSGTILRIFALGLSVIVAFFMMPFMIHSLGDTQYGLWVIIGTITGYYGFLDFGLAPAAARYIAQAHGRSDYEQMNIVSTSSLFLYAILGMVVLAVSCIGAVLIYWYADNYALELAQSATLLGVAFAIQFPSRVFGGILRSYIRHDMVIGIEMVTLIFRTLLVVHFVMAGHGIVTLAIISFGTVILSSLLEFTAAMRVFKEMCFKKRYIQKTVMKSLFAYSKIAFVANLTDLLKISLSPVFVAWIINVQTVVLYAVAFRLLEYFGQLFSNLIKMVTPIFSQLEGRNATERLEQSFVYTTIVSIIATLFVGLNIIYFGEAFIILWMGEEYRTSYDILWIVGISFIGFLIQMPSKELLFGTSNHKFYAIKSTLSLVTASLFSIIGGHLYGLYGFAIGLSTGILLPEFILPYIMCKVFTISFVKVYIQILLPVFIKTLFTLGVIFSTITLLGIQLDSYSKLIMCAIWSSISFGTFIVIFILPKSIRTMAYSLVQSKVSIMRAKIS